MSFRPKPWILTLIVGLTLLSLFLHFLFPVPNWIVVSWHGLNYSFSEDSPEFARGVIDFPGADFFDANIRMNRPLYVFMGWLVYKSLKILSIDRIIPSDLVKLCYDFMKRAFTRADMWISKYSPADIILSWISLTIVNAVILFCSLLILVLLFTEITGSFKLTLLLVLIFFLDARLSLEDMGWAPHTTVFDILIPAFCLYSCFKLWRDDGDYYQSCLIAGILMLGKGEFFAPLVVALFPVFIRKISWVKGLIGLALGLSPLLFYLLFLKACGYRLYNHEVEVYRQGFWYIDVLKREGVIALAGKALVKGVDILQNALVSMRFGFLSLLMLSIRSPVRVSFDPFGRFVSTFGAIYIAFCFLFWLWVGFVPVRLMFTFYPAVYLLVSFLLKGGVLRS